MNSDELLKIVDHIRSLERMATKMTQATCDIEAAVRWLGCCETLDEKQVKKLKSAANVLMRQRNNVIGVICDTTKEIQKKKTVIASLFIADE